MIFENPVHNRDQNSIKLPAVGSSGWYKQKHERVEKYVMSTIKQ